MPLHDDTPPNGDYAAYIEKLMQRSQAGTPGLAAGDAGKTRKPAGIRALQDAAQKALQEAKRKAAQSSASAAPASGTQKNTGTASARPVMTAPAAARSAPASPRFDSAWQAQKPASMNATVGSPASYGDIRADAAAASSPPRSSSASNSQGHNQSTSQGHNQSNNQSQGSKKRSYLPLILAVLFLMPLLNIARDMLNNPRPEGLFLVIVAVFVIFSIRHSIKSGNEPDKGKRRPAIKKDDDYPNTGQ
ncbi:hypothetical protein [Kerstersia sp.]|uniref:hypothetical protein n=1 Tax=Kerstersia sp. TaxID=1930783 RepID=UPI003F918C78